EDYGFLQEIWGGELQLNSHFAPFGLPNNLTYGVTAELTSTSHPRNALMTDLISGETSNFVNGAVFPTKNFPDTDTTKLAAYVQDEIIIGRLTLLPGVRIDYYHLDPKPDAAFANSNGSDFPVHSLSKTPISPKFGATFHLTDEYTLFG